MIGHGLNLVNGFETSHVKVYEIEVYAINREIKIYCKIKEIERR